MFLAIILACSCPSSGGPYKKPITNIIVTDEKSRLLEQDVDKNTFNANKCEKVHCKCSLRTRYKQLKPFFYINCFYLDKCLPADDRNNAVVVPFLKELYVNFISSYSNGIILKRCLWYIFSMAAYIEVYNK